MGWEYTGGNKIFLYDDVLFQMLYYFRSTIPHKVNNLTTKSLNTTFLQNKPVIN